MIMWLLLSSYGYIFWLQKPKVGLGNYSWRNNKLGLSWAEGSHEMKPYDIDNVDDIDVIDNIDDVENINKMQCYECNAMNAM